MNNAQGGSVTEIRSGETLIIKSGGSLQTDAGANVNLSDGAVVAGVQSVTKTSATTTTVLTAHPTKTRTVQVTVKVDETYAIGTGTLPTVKIGETGTLEKAMAATVLDTEAAGIILTFAFQNTATKDVVITTTAAVGNATGGCTVTAIAIPTT